MQELNKEVLQYLNSLLDYKAIEYIVIVFSDGPIFFLPIFLLVLWFYYTFKKNKEKKNILILIFYSTVLGIAISLAIQQFVNIERPETAILGTGKLILEHIPDASFPSDHATVSFAFLTSLYFWKYKRTFYILLPIIILMNISRVIAGVHWPFDIIAGTLVGVSSSYIIYIFRDNKYLIKFNDCIIKIAGIFKL